MDVDLKDDDNVTFFIDDTDEGFNGSRGTWDRLKEVDETYGAFTKDGYITNIAAYTVSDDVYAINDAEDASNRETYYVHEVDTDGIDLDDRNLDSLNWNDVDTNEDWRIQTVTGTQYYLVVKDSDGDIDQILTWVGYKNAPDAAELGSVTYAYAVTHESDSVPTMWPSGGSSRPNTTADRDTYFVYAANNWQDLEYVWGIGYGEDGAIVDERINVDDANGWLFVGGPIQFYVIDKDGNVPTFINKDYDEYYIYAGEVDVIDDTTKYDYFQVADTCQG